MPSDPRGDRPRTGTPTATRAPFVPLTSNATREPSEAPARSLPCACTSTSRDPPSCRILLSLSSRAALSTSSRELVRIIGVPGGMQLKKVPSIADYRQSVLALGPDTIDDAVAAATLGVVQAPTGPATGHRRACVGTSGFWLRAASATSPMGCPDTAACSAARRGFRPVRDGGCRLVRMATLGLGDRGGCEGMLACCAGLDHRDTYDAMFDLWLPRHWGLGRSVTTEGLSRQARGGLPPDDVEAMRQLPCWICWPTTKTWPATSGWWR